jgi:hypothetical protein
VGKALVMGFWPGATEVEMAGKMGQEILEGKGERNYGNIR